MSKDIEKTKSTNNSSKLFELAAIEKKSVEVSFSGTDISADGGLLLLREVENQTKIIQQLSTCIQDPRHQGYVQHSIESLLSQRVFQIAAGYEDANDCNELKNDKILKISCGQLPETGSALASQPTMSRFENQPTRSELYKMSYVLVDNFVASYTEEPPVIIIDSDDTNSNTYGQQELALFNNYYGDYCYMPLHIYEGLSGKLIAAILKPGRRSKNINVYSILKRLISHLRKTWKHTVIIVRGDSHFCCQELMDWSHDKKGIHFITGLTGNSVLNKLSEVTKISAEREYNQYGTPVKRYHSFEYKAGSWSHAQRVIVKIEVSSMGTNIRYVVTDMREYRTQQLYELGYCARGNMELRIKDHKLYLQSDRMSCNSFLANQMRLVLHSAAYVLMHALQKEILKGTEYATATMKTIQLKIIKVAARVKELGTKIKIELPLNFPTKEVFQKSLLMFEWLRC